MKRTVNFIYLWVLIFALSLFFLGVRFAPWTYSAWHIHQKPLASLVIVLDPGHGGWDNGAERSQIVEDEINFLIVEKLYSLLLNAGSIVYLTRAGDYDLASLYATNRKREDINRRVRFIQQINPDFFISIHLNVFTQTSVHGGQAFFNFGNEEGKALADLIQGQLNELSKEDKVAKTGDFFILEETKVPGVLVECGFLSNPDERKRLLTSSYQNQVAQSIFEAILQFHQENQIRNETF